MKDQEWLIEWLENYVRPTSKLKTHMRYEQIVHSHLIPRLGSYELEELTPQLLQHQIVDMGKCGNKRTGKGLAPSTLNLIVAVIQDSLTTAYSIEITKIYMADKISTVSDFSHHFIFSNETKEQVADIIYAYKNGLSTDKKIKRIK